MPDPRIVPLPPEKWDERLTRVLQAPMGGVEEPMNIFTSWPVRGAVPALDRVRRCTPRAHLPGRLREFVVLRTGAPSTVPTSGPNTYRAG